MKKYNKSVCVVDQGLFVELAVTLTKHFDRVFYHYLGQQYSAFPRSNPAYVGKGMGIDVVSSMWDIKNEVDCWIFPDVFAGDLQEELVSQGKLVFGSRMAEKLETHRAEAKRHFTKLGIPVGSYEVVKGIADLRKYLKENKNQFVKCSVYRGDFETFASPNYKYAEPKIDDLEHVLGFKKYTAEFIVEANIPAVVEVGYDGFCIDGQWPQRSLVGIEIKDKCYIGKMMEFDKLPPQISSFNKKIAPALEKYKCRNFFSSELRITEDKKSYILDPCVRAGNPPLFSELEFYENLGEIIWHGAHGIAVDPVSRNQWAVQAQISSDWIGVNRLAIQFPEEIRSQVKLLNATKIQGQYYIIPQDHKITSLGAVVGVGKTLQEAVNKCKKAAEQVKGYFVECSVGSLDEAESEWQKLSNIGMKL